jgi:hypothetical protein
MAVLLDSGDVSHPSTYLESLHDMINHDMTVHDKLVHGCPGPRPYLESLRDKVVHDELVHSSPGHWHPGQLFHPVLSKVLLFPGLK